MREDHTDQTSTRSVVLLHTLGDGRSHLDWMIERADVADEYRLLTFRVGARPDSWVARFGATRIRDHRAAYLDHEGATRSGVGSVRRLARGEVLGLEITERTIRCTIGWARGVVCYSGVVAGDGESWVFERE